MDTVERYFKHHQFLLQILGSILVIAVTLTAYAYNNFATKAEVKERADQLEGSHQELYKMLQKQLDRMEYKIDHFHR
jgi:hypothetical protein